MTTPQDLLAERLKLAMTEAGVGVEELARELGVSWRTVARWRSPRGTKPSYERLAEIAERLGKPVSYFVDEKVAA